MKKTNEKGFMLAETLIVTTFVAGVLVFLFIQFTNLNKVFNESFKYNTVENLYALEDIKNYIESDDGAYNFLSLNVTNGKYVDITDCSIFSNVTFCSKLFKKENITKIFVTTNAFDVSIFDINNEDFLNFINKISKDSKEKYRLIAMFSNNTYATVRFGV